MAVDTLGHLLAVHVTPANEQERAQVALPAPSCAPAPDIRIELRRGATSISLTWPVCAAEHCAAWMRDLLK